MPGLKFVTIPNEIELRDLLTDTVALKDDGKPFTLSFKNFVFRILAHESFGSTFEMVRSAHAIAGSIEKAKPGDVITMAGDDWENLKTGITVHYASVGLVTLGMIQIMPFFDAILGASDNSPN